MEIKVTQEQVEPVEEGGHMANQGNVLPRVLCASCRHCTSRELVRGHRRRGWCEVGHAWVPLAKVRECLYWRPFGGDPQ